MRCESRDGLTFQHSLLSDCDEMVMHVGMTKVAGLRMGTAFADYKDDIRRKSSVFDQASVR